MASRSRISLSVIKTLFASSSNVCAYTRCEEKLTDPRWDTVNAEIAHISGERPTAPRWDGSMTDAERNGYENLILLCPKHHKLIDRLRPNDHSVEVLQEMKGRAEMHGGTGGGWASDDELTHYARLLVASTEREQ